MTVCALQRSEHWESGCCRMPRSRLLIREPGVNTRPLVVATITRPADGGSRTLRPGTYRGDACRLSNLSAERDHERRETAKDCEDGRHDPERILVALLIRRVVVRDFPARACDDTATPAGVAAFVRKLTASRGSNSGEFIICLVDFGTRTTERYYGRRESAKHTQGNCHDPERISKQFSSSFRSVATASFAAESNLDCWVAITGIAES